MESKTATSWDALFERTAAGTGCTNKTQPAGGWSEGVYMEAGAEKNKSKNQ